MTTPRFRIITLGEQSRVLVVMDCATAYLEYPNHYSWN